MSRPTPPASCPLVLRAHITPAITPTLYLHPGGQHAGSHRRRRRQPGRRRRQRSVETDTDGERRGAVHDGRCRPRNNIHVGPQQTCRPCLPTYLPPSLPPHPSINPTTPGTLLFLAGALLFFKRHYSCMLSVCE